MDNFHWGERDLHHCHKHNIGDNWVHQEQQSDKNSSRMYDPHS
jgi:hypothetical protein